MSYVRTSVALTGDVHAGLTQHLLRPDWQEDVCLALYRPSTGTTRRTALVRRAVMPREAERLVHGNASFTTEYVLRASAEAAEETSGVVALHSHPGSRGWQGIEGTDRKTEASYANLVREVTGLPLVGMTLAGDERWSARFWDVGVGHDVAPRECENVRVLHGDRLVVSWNDRLRPPPPVGSSQVRAVSCWGGSVQADIARLRVLVVGAGSVGLVVAVALAATGVEQVSTMDFDTVKEVNLDRLLGASAFDAHIGRSKVELARRLVAEASTATKRVDAHWEDSVCEPHGLDRALDFDVVFSCVDRPWPRHVLNTIAYSDLIPVIDGGIHADPLPGGGMRGAMWRSHVAGPGRICLACNGQYHPSQVMVERDGSLDDPTYISQLAEPHPERARQNVSFLSVNCAGALLAQFVSLVVAPGGLGDPGPIRYHLSMHWLQHDDVNQCIENCPYPGMTGIGDYRQDATGQHAAAEKERAERLRAARRPRTRGIRALDKGLAKAHVLLERLTKMG